MILISTPISQLRPTKFSALPFLLQSDFQESEGPVEAAIECLGLVLVLSVTCCGAVEPVHLWERRRKMSSMFCSQRHRKQVPKSKIEFSKRNEMERRKEKKRKKKMEKRKRKEKMKNEGGFFFSFSFSFFFFLFLFLFFSLLFPTSHSDPNYATLPLFSVTFALSKRSSQPLEGWLRVLGEDTVLPRPKHTVAQHHLQLHWKCLSNLKEPSCLVC